MGKFYWTRDENGEDKCIATGSIEGTDITHMTNEEVKKLRQQQYQKKTQKQGNYDKNHMFKIDTIWSEKEGRYKYYGSENNKLLCGEDITDLDKLEIKKLRQNNFEKIKKHNKTEEQKKRKAYANRKSYFRQNGRELDEYKKPGPKFKYIYD